MMICKYKIVKIPENVKVLKTVIGLKRELKYNSKYKSYYYVDKRKKIHYDPQIHKNIKLDEIVTVKHGKKRGVSKSCYIVNV